MKVSEFISNIGIEKAKKVLNKTPHSATLCRVTPQSNHLYYRYKDGEYQVYFQLSDEWWESSIQESNEFTLISELKQMVDSFELIKKLGGLISAKSALAVIEFETGDYPEKLKQSIADYEAVEALKVGDQ